jgi:hypothetical protein
MTYSPRAIIATMVLSFSVSFAFMWWQRKAPELPPTTPLAARAVAHAPIAAPLLPPSPPTDAPRAFPPAVKDTAAPPPNQAPARNDFAPELPVIFGIIKKSVYSAEEDGTGNSTKVNEGIVSNTSDKSLTLAVTEVNIPTQETTAAEVVVPRGTQKHFGAELGLKMLSGDQLTLRNPAYQDLTRQIP